MPHGVKAEVRLYVGDVEASRGGVVLTTLLGSCVGVCLFDPVARVGGMNHFALTDPQQRRREESARFGPDAMNALLLWMSRLGAERCRLVAKVFGGARMLESSSGLDIALSNVAFAREFLLEQEIRIVGRDVGDDCPRQVRFHTDTGRAFVRRMPRAKGDPRG